MQYSIPDYVRVSADCRNLLSHIFVANPAKVFCIFSLEKYAYHWFVHITLILLIYVLKEDYHPGDQAASLVSEKLTKRTG